MQSTHPAICTLNHACQEGCLVGEIFDTQGLQTRNTHGCATEPSGPTRPASVGLPQHLCVDAWQAELGDIRYDDEGTGEDAFVTSLCSLDHLASQDNVQSVFLFWG